MPYKTCRHLMENGNSCQSPALSKRDYCYFHIEFRARRLKMARARARSEQWWLDLPCIEDMRSCEAATSRVIEGMAAQVIDPARGKALLSGLRLAASNFKARKAWDSHSDYRVNEACAFIGSYPGFEAVHDLPKDLDLDEDPLKLFPMPEVETEDVPQVRDLPLGANLGSLPLQPTDGLNGAPEASERARILQEAATPVDYMSLEVTAEDMEVWDIAEREGEQASWKRAAALERNRRRRERRLQRARYEEMARNRNIQTAAMRIARDQKRAEAEQQRQAAAAGTQADSSIAQTATGDAIGQAGLAPSPEGTGRKPAQSEVAPTSQAAASAPA